MSLPVFKTCKACGEPSSVFFSVDYGAENICYVCKRCVWRVMEGSVLEIDIDGNTLRISDQDGYLVCELGGIEDSNIDLFYRYVR